MNIYISSNHIFFSWGKHQLSILRVFDRFFFDIWKWSKMVLEAAVAVGFLAGGGRPPQGRNTNSCYCGRASLFSKSIYGRPWTFWKTSKNLPAPRKTFKNPSLETFVLLFVLPAKCSRNHRKSKVCPKGHMTCNNRFVRTFPTQEISSQIDNSLNYFLHMVLKKAQVSLK